MEIRVDRIGLERVNLLDDAMSAIPVACFILAERVK